MKHLDNLLGACAFTLYTITIAAFLAVFAGWAYSELGMYEQELIALATRPPVAWGEGHATVERGSAEGHAARIVQLEPLTVIGHRDAPEVAAEALAEEHNPHALPRGRS